MFLEIDLSSETPIYIQLMYQLKKGIIKGEVLPEESLPSVRVLAGDLGVNMHTVNKAYNLLTEEGILTKNQRGYSLQPIHLRIQTEESKYLMKERLENLMIDAFVHQLSEADMENWKVEIMKELEQEE